MSITVESRLDDEQEVKELVKRYQRLSEAEKHVMQSAIHVFFAIFQKDPSRYQFDFRFNRR